MRIVIRVVLILIAAFVLFIRFRPDTYHVERSISVNAAPAVVYAQVADFHKWDGWSPWAKLDANMKTTYDGPAAGKGASYAWVGNDKVGEGKMTITDERPNEELAIHLQFIKPFASDCTTGFQLSPEGAGTKVVWTMDGKHNFMSKVMCLFKSMDSMIGGDYEKGLSQLKQVSESAATTAPAAADSSAAAATAAPAGEKPATK